MANGILTFSGVIMNKVAVILTTVVVAGFCWVEFLAIATRTHSDGVRSTEERTLHDQLVNYQIFKQTLVQTLDSLEAGTLRLKEARERVVSSAQTYRPEYFELLDRCERGTTLEEHVASNLLGHFRHRLELRPELAPRLRELEKELEALIHEDAKVRH